MYVAVRFFFRFIFVYITKFNSSGAAPSGPWRRYIRRMICPYKRRRGLVRKNEYLDKLTRVKSS